MVIACKYHRYIVEEEVEDRTFLILPFRAK